MQNSRRPKRLDNSKRSTICYYVIYYISLFCFIYFVFVGIPLWSGLVMWFIKRMKENKEYLGFLGFVLPEIFLTTVPLVIFLKLIDRRCLNKNLQDTPNGKVALIIPCHKAENIINPTLEKALKIFDAKDIYVIDNGNSDIPLDNTRWVCEELGVNYMWCNMGSKFISIYVGVKLAYNYEYVMQMDDDMELDDDMKFLLDEKVDCVAYTISGISKYKKNNLLQHCQDIEYKISGIIKCLQSWLGNTIFAHGAISLWKRESLIKVLESHPAYPISDDWFTGFTANRLGMRIEVCNHKFISTDTPSTLFFSGRKSGYGDATLLKQRLFRWYALIGLQIVYQLYYIFFIWTLPFKRIIFQKIFLLWYLFVMLIVSFRYFILGYALFISPTFTCIMIGVTLGIWVTHFIVINYTFLKQEERFPWYMIFIQPVYTMYDIIILSCGIMYGVFYKIPNVLFTPRTKILENEKINKLLVKYTLKKIKEQDSEQITNKSE